MAKGSKSKQQVKPMDDKNRQKALKAALDRIEKDFGKGANGFDEANVVEDAIPTGALS